MNQTMFFFVETVIYTAGNSDFVTNGYGESWDAFCKKL